MSQALEDTFLGPMVSPSFTGSLLFRWEDSHRRVRALFNGLTIADSTGVMLFHEAGYLPVFYFPFADVRWDVLEVSDHTTYSPLKGNASYWTIHVGDRVAEHVAWSYRDLLPGAPPIKDYMAFYWDQMDAWYEEDEQVFAHARDPYKGVHILPSSRHVEVVLGAVTIADTHRPSLLIETGLPVRYYIPQQDIRLELLEPSVSSSRCPYKGQASYWSAKIGEKIYKNIAWSYRNPLPACMSVAHFLSFYNERVDAIYVDGQQVPVPQTQWSE